MAGIYIHIPFCKQACSYCNFHFSTSQKNKKPLIEAIRKELQLRKNEINENVKSIYFGGGTPSLLSNDEIDSILNCINKSYSVESDVEITLEANPDDLSKNKINSLKKSGINRLSIGIQSFYDDDLEFMDRAHNSVEAKNAILYSQDSGFENINIDLIFGIHTLSDNKWKENIELFKSLDIKHLSAYSLTEEENTKLIHNIRKGKVDPVDDEKSYRQYMILQESLSNNLIQYELSNYCKPHYQSKHNSSYWDLSNYLGVGPSAHSFNGKNRRWNVANNAVYLKSINNKTSFYDSEKLSEIERYHDYLIIRLRTVEGISFESIRGMFSYNVQKHFFSSIKKLDQQKVRLTSNSISIPQIQLFTSDEIIRELMID